MQLQNQYIEIGCMRGLVIKKEEKLTGQVCHRKKHKHWRKECLTQQMFLYLQEMIIIENSIAIFMD